MDNNVNIPLEEIIKRKINYHRNDDDSDLIALNAGYIRGFEQMLDDMNLTEKEFIEKYSILIQTLAKKIESVDINESNEYIDDLSGYNNAIVDVLSLLNFEYFYDK